MCAFWKRKKSNAFGRVWRCARHVAAESAVRQLGKMPPPPSWFGTPSLALGVNPLQQSRHRPIRRRTYARGTIASADVSRKPNWKIKEKFISRLRRRHRLCRVSTGLQNHWNNCVLVFTKKKKTCGLFYIYIYSVKPPNSGRFYGNGDIFTAFLYKKTPPPEYRTL